MRNFRKLMSLVVIFTMMISTIAFAAIPSDVKDTDYEEAVVTLGALEVIMGYDEDGVLSFKPDQTITRAEFAAVITRVIGMGSASNATKGATPFVDVPVDHWATGNINLAYQQGIIAGHGDGTFGPEDPVTYEQAVKMIVSALGYDPAAAQKGGYPTGYLVIASQERITSNVRGSAGEPAIRGTVAKLLFNSLEVKLMEQTGYGKDPIFEQVERTLLEDKLDVIKMTGAVISNENTSLTSATSTSRDGEVRIDVDFDRLNDNIIEGARDFVAGDTNAAEYLGYRVNFYVKEDRYGDDVIISISPKSGENEALTIAAADIAKVSEVRGSVKTNEYYYWVDKDYDDYPENAEVNKTLNVIKNGKFFEKVTNFDFDDYKNNIPASGKVVLLSNDRDDIYDYMFITDYQVGVVEEVNTRTKKIIFNNDFGAPRNIELDKSQDKRLKYTIIKEGKEIDLEDIQEWDILSIAESEGGGARLVNIVVSNAKVEGMITEVDDDRDPENPKVYIDGKEYGLSSNVDMSYFELQDEGVFYLDADGRIAANDTTANMSDNYAYLMDIAKVDGFGAPYQIRALTKNGNMSNFDFADRVNLRGTADDDGTYRSTGDYTFDELFDILHGGVANSTKADRQLITYELDNNGKIKTITLAGKLGVGEYENRKNFVNVLETSTQEYRESSNRIGKQYYVDNNTIIFEVDPDTNEDNWTVRKINMLKDEGEYEVALYDSSADRIVKVMVVTKGVVGLGDTPITLVDRITQIEGKSGGKAHKLYGIYDDNDNYIIDAEDTNIFVDDSTYGRGDIVQIATNSRDEAADGTIRLFSAEDRNLTSHAVYDYEADEYVAYGEVVSKVRNTMTLRLRDKDGNVLEDAEGNPVERPFVVNTAKVYKYDHTKKTVSLSDSGDIEASDTDVANDLNANDSERKFAFVRVYDNMIEEIVIYKWN